MAAARVFRRRPLDRAHASMLMRVRRACGCSQNWEPMRARTAAALDGLAAVLVHLVEEALVPLPRPVLLPQLLG